MSEKFYDSFCRNCCFGVRINSDLVECRKYPPSIPHPAGKRDSYWETVMVWPGVNPDGFCGEHLPHQQKGGKDDG